MIDWIRVRELREEIGADAFEEVLDLFLEEVETALAVLRTATTEDDLEAQLHFLKGSALNLGFETLANLCADGEAKSGAGARDSVDIPRIVSGYEASKAAFLAGIAEGIAA
ncbi:histidine kinase [Roseovarius sp. A46]|uniref:Hpt domain-containing protein n=1 Tax=Roseovarius sp. A46 TaxID=2109331 RepID=UPI0010108CB2|nr:Hpt domain-containing protein [Roseovarius sp. A46]RXV70111.1 histidine kinase [Roseovarius sp. A46]